MYAFCQQAICRHRALVTYFGQSYESGNCGACDVCLAETVAGEDTSEVTQKVLAAVAELRGRFGAAHVAAVLAGASTARIRELRHDQLAGYGALREDKQGQVRAWIDQLIGHGYLARTEDEYPTLRLAARGAAVLRGEETAPALTSARAVKATAADTLPPAAAPAGSAERAPVAPDPLLFERLRSLRRTIAEERGVPPYLIFSDASLRDMVRRHPTTREELLEVKGVGEWKSQAFGERFLALLRQPVS